MLESITNW